MKELYVDILEKTLLSFIHITYPDGHCLMDPNHASNYAKTLMEEKVLLGYSTVLLRYLALPETVPNGTFEVAQRYFGWYLTVVPGTVNGTFVKFFVTRTVQCTSSG